MPDITRIQNSDIIDPSASRSCWNAPVLPAARHDIAIRPGVPTDYEFIDDLQKKNKRGVGFMWEKAIRGHLEKGNVLVAEKAGGSERVGYVLGVGRYLKRDELGVIYQMCVVPEFRRSLVAANLLKAKFEASAYGCRLYCCWCAQDLAANKFWEAMGFVPLAFRTGGGRRKKEGPRMHIFWQKRIRVGDEGDLANGGTSYWFPSQTGAGAIAEDRIVLPIPPGTHWGDVMPIVLPESSRTTGEGGDEIKLLEDEVLRLEKEKKAALKRSQSGKNATAPLAAKPQKSVGSGGLSFGPTPAPEPKVDAKREAATQNAALEAELKEAKLAVKRAKKTFDPAQIAFARELKDRWLEEVQARPGLLEEKTEARYAVGRVLSERVEVDRQGIKRLDAA